MKKRMEKVSVIIPAYNVGNYIHRAIESVLKQTYENIELVVVDDGSTDHTWNVIQEYAKADIRMRAFRQENRGVSSARNYALDNTSGDYVMFLDSDDWLEKNAVEYLMTLQEEYQECLVSASAYYVKIINHSIEKTLQKQPSPLVKVSQREALMNIGTTKYNLRSSCYKLFNSKYLKGMHFNESYYHGEDGLFVFEYLMKCQGLVFATEPLWNILERPGSATNSPYNSRWLTAVDAAEQMLYYDFDPELRDALIMNVIDRTEVVEKTAVRSGKVPKEELLYLKNKLLVYKKAFFSKKRSTKEYAKYVLYANCPIPLVRFITKFLS